MTTRRRNSIALVAILALAAAGLYLATPAAKTRSASDAIPAGAFLLVTVDLNGLRASPLAREVGTFQEVNEVTQRCGFDPLERAKSVAIGVPEKPDGVFGLAVASDLTRDELARCADHVMGARGASPRITEKNGWALLEQDEVTEAVAPKGKIAYRDGAPLLVARGDYLSEMQAAIEGNKPRAVAEPEHAALRASAQAHAPAPLVLATAVLPRSLRDKLKKQLEAEIAAANEPSTKTETMSAVLSVSSVALAISSHERSSDLDLFAELRCESEGACEAVRDFIDQKRKALARQPSARFIGLGALLDALILEVHGTSLDLTLTAPESEIARAVRGVFAYTSPQPSTPPTPSASAPRPPPDETLRAKDAGTTPKR